MPSPISVKISVASWMKRYLEFQSEDGESKILTFSRKHEYNIFIMRLVSNYKRNVVSAKPVDENVKLNSEVKINLPFSDRKDVYFYNYLSRASMQIFRAEIELDMLFDFKRYLRTEILNGKQKKIAIREFFEKHNITEDDIKYESFERKHTRYMNKTKRNL